LKDLAPNESDSAYLFVDVERTAYPVCLHLRGELDLGSVKLVSDALMRLELEGADPVIVDLSEVSFMDCSGLSVLVGAFNRSCRDDRELLIVNARPAVRRVFSLTGCGDILADPAMEPITA